MRVVTFIAAVIIPAVTGIAYITYASKANRDRPIPPIFHTIPRVPVWMDLLCWSIWGASVVVFLHMLPMWACIALFYAVVAPPWEVIRRRHNRRVERAPARAGGSRVP
ncbi:hypothetical protein [Streptomyces venezuelae]|uniref:hypothetical protein n=1 Tax=Streptomyces venezuelae TaxID=54571 RepID=UPI00331B4834